MKPIKFSVMRRAIEIYAEKFERTGLESWKQKAAEMAVRHDNEILRLARRMGAHKLGRG